MLAIGFDLANLLAPVPNLVRVVGETIGPAFDAPTQLSLVEWLRLALLTALPGLFWMGAVLLVLRRGLRLANQMDPVKGRGDSDAPRSLAEQRFRDVVAEMAVAAAIHEPRVVIEASNALNALVFGNSEADATIVVSRTVVDTFGRQEMQGIAAHLVGSIANGDMAIGGRMACSFGLFALIARFAEAFTERAVLLRLFRAFLRLALHPTQDAARELMEEVVQSRPASGTRANDWRMLLWMPLAGPIFISGVLVGLVDLLLLGPLVCGAWRQRKYLADATAVRLARDPDALEQALRRLSGGGEQPFSPWVAQLCVVAPLQWHSGFLGGSIVAPIPSLERRLRALGALGGGISAPRRRISPQMIILLAPLVLCALALSAVAIYLLVMLSFGLSALLLGLPFGAIHMTLRWLGN